MTTNYTTSTAPKAVAYLVEAIQNQLSQDPDNSQILLTLADPGDGPDVPAEIIQIGAVHDAIDPSAFTGSGGQFSLEEAYDIDCVVSAWTGSSDVDGALTIQVEQVQRVWQLLGYVWTAIRLDPSLGELVQRAYPKEVEQTEVQWTPDPVGLIVEIPFQIHVEAVI